MNPKQSTIFIFSVAVSSLVIGVLISIQISYAQLGQSNFEIENPNPSNFSNDIQQSSNQSMNEAIVIANNNEGTYFIWESSDEGPSEIILSKRTINGFDYKINLSNSSTAESTDPNMLVEDRNIYFTWWEIYENGTKAPMFRASSDSGTTFGGITNLSDLPFR